MNPLLLTAILSKEASSNVCAKTKYAARIGAVPKRSSPCFPLRNLNAFAVSKAAFTFAKSLSVGSVGESPLIPFWQLYWLAAERRYWPRIVSSACFIATPKRSLTQERTFTVTFVTNFQEIPDGWRGSLLHFPHDVTAVFRAPHLFTFYQFFKPMPNSTFFHT